MALLALYKDALVISSNRDVLFVNSIGTVLYKLTLPPIDTTKLTKPQKTAEPSDEQEEIVEEELEITGTTLELCKIQHIAVAGNNELLAITTAEEKILYMYKLSDSGAEFISKRDIARTSNVIRFGPDFKQLLVADKTGDCYIYDCATATPGKWLLGHFSMVLDSILTADLKYIITCDRDEKIRITNYPESYLIECYCLGHEEYVAAVEFLPTASDETLISISGDQTLKLWQYQSGVELLNFNLPAPALRMATRQLGDRNHVAVTLFEYHTKLVIYEIAKVESNYSCRQISEHKYENVKDLSTLFFNQNGDLILGAVSEENTIKVHKLEYVDDHYTVAPLAQLNEAITTNLQSQNVQFNGEEISLLFKKKFDNIHNYQERKKRRLEEKNKNKS